MSQIAKQKVESLLLVFFLLLFGVEILMRVNQIANAPATPEAEKASAEGAENVAPNMTEPSREAEPGREEAPGTKETADTSESGEWREKEEERTPPQGEDEPTNENKYDSESEEDGTVNSKEPQKNEKKKEKVFVNKYGYEQYTSYGKASRRGPKIVTILYCTS